MPRSKGRSPGFVMSDEHRVKIRNSNILTALIQHVEGAREMSATQVTAGLGLLRKVLPDLSSVEHSGELNVNTEDLNEHELAGALGAIRQALSTGAGTSSSSGIGQAANPGETKH